MRKQHTQTKHAGHKTNRTQTKHTPNINQNTHNNKRTSQRRNNKHTHRIKTRNIKIPNTNNTQYIHKETHAPLYKTHKPIKITRTHEKNTHTQTKQFTRNNTRKKEHSQ